MPLLTGNSCTLEKPIMANFSFNFVDGHDVQTPFRISAANGNKQIEVKCETVLRILPGKRMVCSGTSHGRRVVVKIFLESKRAEKHLLREKRGYIYLQNAGIDCPEILFQGQTKPGGHSLLVFEEIYPAVGFDSVWVEAGNDEHRAALLQQIIAVIAAQHKAGLYHDDMHLGNFLFSGSALYTIDGAAIHYQSNGLNQRRSIENLALLFAQLYPKFDFLIPGAFQVYLEKRQWQFSSGLYNKLIRKIRSQRSYRKKKYLKKIFRQSSAYICKKSRKDFLICDRKLYGQAMADFFKDPDSFIDSAKLLKDGHSSTVALVEVDGQLLVMKRYNIKSTKHAVLRAPRPSRAWKSWENAHHLSLLGIETPKPVAMLEKRFGPFRSMAYYITEFVDGTGFNELLSSGNLDEDLIECLAGQFVSFLQLLADQSVAHGDLKASNFILSDKKLVVLDLDAMTRYRNPFKLRDKIQKDCRRLLKNFQNFPEIHEQFQSHLQKKGFRFVF